jgi:hypothetical protein
MNNKLERIWKETAVDQSRCHPENCLEEPKKYVKNLIYDSKLPLSLLAVDALKFTLQKHSPLPIIQKLHISRPNWLPSSGI